ncbi:hypothetical protein AVEN_203986-1 [Araneus ventricosus]|uniref:Uncharacterized protein n=1 Tax=Araneus ventricosus TaxID=182803 RepID=A0A4Y2QJQ0_ARAVE|nr:hypothetical protein AVEN_46745-1 [Araneus ventricosus]GBN63509.1 hypothetical protein AVEN_94854-1 [Araneus ventricosus]GBN63516.1 hypothetical protein AVEN_142505-1 [Araneus ventricosus]GBN63523.1 hypothetical protein AVEN_203986-1 [Araneus ventricosus]
MWSRDNIGFRAGGSNSTENPPCKRDWCMLSLPRSKRPRCIRSGSFELWIPAQVPYSASDHWSKLQVSFQNNPRVASKQSISLTKESPKPPSRQSISSLFFVLIKRVLPSP